MPSNDPLVQPPPQSDPFLEMLFRDGAPAIGFAALIVALSLLAYLRWRRLRAQAREDDA